MKMHHLMIGVVGGFLAIFLLIPLVTLGLTAFTSKPVGIFERLSKMEVIPLARDIASQLTLEPIKDLGRVRRYRKAARNSLLVAIAVATWASMAALPASLALARGFLAGRGILGFLLLLPLALHSYLFSFAVILIFGHDGLLMRLLGFSPIDPFSVWGLILAQTAAFVPLAILVQAPAIALYSSGWEAIAASLGSSSLLTLSRVWWPLNSKALMAGWFLIAIRSMGDFVTPMILTSTRWRLLVLEAWRDLAGSNWWSGAAALSLEMLLLCSLLMFLERFYSKKDQGVSVVSGIYWDYSDRSWLRRVLVVYVALLGVLPLMGLGVIFLSSVGFFSGQALTFEHYREVAGDFLKAMGVSLTLGILVAILGNVAGIILSKPDSSSWRRWQKALGVMAAFAFALPSTIYAISLVGVFNRPPFFLHFTPTLLILALLATRMSYSIRILSSVWEKLGDRWDDAIRVNGASPLLAWRWASLPYLKGALIAGGALMFISAVQDVGLSVLIAPPRFYPLSLVIARNIADGLFAQGAALAMGSLIILMAPLAVALKFLGRFSREDFGF